MKNIIYFIAIIACVGLIIFGITRKPAAPTDQSSNQQQSAAIPAVSTPAKNVADQANSPAVITAATATSIKANAKIYRPDTSSQSNNSFQSTTVTPDAARDFQITNDLLAKMHLIDKYKPGICFGLAVAVPQVAIDSMISNNQSLTQFLRQHYNLTADLEVYNKMKQLQGITLTEVASSKFNFTFMDGQCSDVVYYEGTVEVSANQVIDTVTNRQAHSYQ